MPNIELSSLTKIFGSGFVAVDSVGLRAKEGEMITLLGPSGCGKTTTLRMVAGLEQATSGSIRIGDRDVYNAALGINVPPENRGLGMVFQSYAIWPHMTVAQNVAYPLRMRRVAPDRQRELVSKILATVGMADQGEKMATKLSGGQQQRVALARALVFDPAILLLDEPLSNLDAKLREHMRIELKQTQKRVGLTALYVTHDQEEALTLSDRIVVMNKGKIEQVGTPQEIYQAPATRFVADFIGKANLIDIAAPIATDTETASCSMPGLDGETRFVLPRTALRASGRNDTQSVPSLFVRPDKIGMHRGKIDERNGQTVVPGLVEEHLFAGEYHEYVVAIDRAGTVLKVKTPADGEPVRVGDAVALTIQGRDALVYGAQA